MDTELAFTFDYAASADPQLAHASSADLFVLFDQYDVRSANDEAADDDAGPYTNLYATPGW